MTINSIGILKEMERLGITEAKEIGFGFIVGERITFYDLGVCRVADTAGDPAWEEEDPQAFAELAEQVGVEL